MNRLQRGEETHLEVILKDYKCTEENRIVAGRFSLERVIVMNWMQGGKTQ